MTKWSDYEDDDPAQTQISVPGTAVTSGKKWEDYEGPATPAVAAPKASEHLKQDQGEPALKAPDWLAKWLPSAKEDNIATNPLTMLKALGEHVPVLGRVNGLDPVRWLNDKHLWGEGHSEKADDEDLARAHEEHPYMTGTANIAGPVLGMGMAGEGLAAKMAEKGMTGFAPTMLSQGTMNAGAGMADKAVGQLQGEETNPSDYFWEALKGYGAAGVGAGLGSMANRSTSEAANVARTNAANYANQSNKLATAREGLEAAGMPSSLGDWSGQGAKRLEELRNIGDTAGRNQTVMDRLMNKAYETNDPTAEIFKRGRLREIIDAQQAAQTAREAHGALATTAERAPKAVHQVSAADRNSAVLEHLQASGLTGGMGYLGSKLLGHSDPITAALIGAGVPAAGRVASYLAHATGLPEKTLQHLQSNSGPAMMNAAIMSVLSGGERDKR